MKNLINQIIIEGPDLSGKTTLYENIHKITKYRWNIQDRSALSMLVFAKLYGRDEFSHVEALNSELNNLNNFVVLLLPSWNVISNRFTKRGDPIHNLTSLRQVYNLFEEAASDLESLPNVYVIRKEVDDFILSELITAFLKFENLNFSQLSESFRNACLTSQSSEKIGLSITSYDNGAFDDVNSDYLNYEPEKVYYKDIEKAIIKKIDDELSGINEYSRIESVHSRRFIYTSPTCISLAHFMLRNNILDCKFFLRSSNTKDTLKYDLNFLKHLSKSVYNFLNLQTARVRIKVVINSAHLPFIIDETKEILNEN